MKIFQKQTDEATLSRFGEEATGMFLRRDFEALANRFGYALAYDRDPASALKADYERAAASPFETAQGESASIVVKYFEPNDTGLFAVVECTIPMENGDVCMNLIVTGKGREKFIAVEDVYGLDC